MNDTVYIVLFRGVGGATQLPTKPLRECLIAAGFRDAATYINSGNALVATDRSRENAAAVIADICEREFGFTKDIMLVTRAEWARAIGRNPFPAAVNVPKSLHLFALSAKPAPSAVKALLARAAPHEGVTVDGTFLYFHVPEGFGISKVPPVIDRLLGVVSTARNWNTVLKLRDLADVMAAKVMADRS
jgi:uncharacterized protein (DUF1697 family)